jgi:DNA-binding transcriptional LysR family regulator
MMNFPKKTEANMLDLNDMRCFAAVAEHSSFTAAAQVLGVPKSSLSRRIAALEDQLGVRLLQRSTRSLAVSELGQAFYQHCSAMLIEAQAAQEVAMNALAQPGGTVQIACPTALLQLRVGALLADYLQRYPQVQLKVLAVNRVVDVIAEGVDIALRVRDEPLEDSELALRSLGQSQEFLLASPRLLGEYGQVASPADLAALPSLAVAGENPRWLLQGADGKKRSVAHKPRLQCSDMNTLLQAATAGLGVVQLPAELVQTALAQGQLQRLLPDWGIAAKNIHAVFPSRRGQLPAVRALLDMLVAAFDCDSQPAPQ